MNDSFDKLARYLDSMYGAPGVVVVLLWCIGIGYLLKMQEFFPNRRIPLFVVAWGMLWNAILRPLPEGVWDHTPGATTWLLLQHFGRLAAVGFIIGLVATVIYDKGLKKLENWIPGLGDFLSTGNGKTQTPGGQPPQPIKDT